MKKAFIALFLLSGIAAFGAVTQTDPTTANHTGAQTFSGVTTLSGTNIVSGTTGISGTTTLRSGAVLNTATGSTVNVSGTLNLSGTSIGNTYQPLDASECYLGATFNYYDEKLEFITSTDALNWRFATDRQITSTSGTVRDPSILYRGGRFIVAFTSDGMSGTNGRFVVGTSTDLANWTFTQITVAAFSGKKTWGPLWFVDPADNSLHLTIAAGDDSVKMLAYEMHPASEIDLTTGWSAPVQITGTALSAASSNNSPYIVYRAGTYYIFYDLLFAANMQEASSSSPFSGYNTVVNSGLNVGEGASVVLLASGTYRLFGEYTIGGCKYRDSSDLTTWSSAADLRQPTSFSHPSVIRLGAAEKQIVLNLVAARDASAFSIQNNGSNAFGVGTFPTTPSTRRPRADGLTISGTGGYHSNLYFDAASADYAAIFTDYDSGGTSNFYIARSPGNSYFKFNAGTNNVTTYGTLSGTNWSVSSAGALVAATVNGNTVSTGTGTLNLNGYSLAAGSSGTLGTAAFTASSAYEVPLTFSTGLTRSTNTITVNTSQNIATLSNLTSNGLVTTSGGTGALSITTTTGSGSAVLGTSGTMTTPTLNGTPTLGSASGWRSALGLKVLSTPYFSVQKASSGASDSSSEFAFENSSDCFVALLGGAGSNTGFRFGNSSSSTAGGFLAASNSGSVLYGVAGTTVITLSGGTLSTGYALTQYTADSSGVGTGAMRCDGGLTIVKTIYTGGGVLSDGDLTTATVGKTLKVKSGANSLSGTFTLTSGTASIASTAIDANTVIVPTIKTAGGTPGTNLPSIVVFSGSANITGAATDTSTYNWVGLKVN